MFVVLSEINCLSALQGIGVFPDEFYTDFETFRNKAIGFKDAVVVIMLAGSCGFNKRLTIELYKTLEKRAHNEKDTGIRSIFLLSDARLTTIKKYYKFTNDFTEAVKVENEKEGKNTVDFWNRFKDGKHATKVFLSDYDNGVCDKAFKRYEDRHNTEDEYTRLIVVPNVKEMLNEA